MPRVQSRRYAHKPQFVARSNVWRRKFDLPGERHNALRSRHALGQFYDQNNVLLTNGLFSTGVIPTQDFNPLSVKLVNQFNAFNAGGVVHVAPVTTGHDHQLLGRIDYKLTNNDSLWFYGLWETHPIPGYAAVHWNRPAGSAGAGSPSPASILVLVDPHLLSHDVERVPAWLYPL